ncbi:MAG: hypothetical protein ACLPWD_04820 [Methanobacterium sp.]
MPETQNTNLNIITPSWYRIDRRVPVTGGSQYTFTTSNNMIQLEIPSGVVNLSKTAIQFTTTILPPPLNYVYVPASYLPHFQRIETTCSGQADLVSLVNVDKYTKLAGPLMLDFEKRSNIDGFMFPSTRIQLNNASVIFSDSYLDSSSAGGNTTVNLQPQSLMGYANYDFDIPNNAGIPNVSQSYIRNHSILLSELLPDSIWALDRDIYIRSSIYLKLYMSTLSKMAICSTSAVGVPLGIGLPPALATLSNIGMQVYYQAAPQALELAMAEALSVFDLIVPVTTNQNIALSGNSQGSTYHFSSVSGNPMNKCYKALFGNFLPDNTTWGCLTNSSNAAYIAPNLLAGQTYVSKLWNFMTLNSHGNGQLIILNADRNEDYTHTINQFGKTSFRSETDFKVCGVLPYVFDSECAMKKYNGDVLVGAGLNQNAIDFNTLFTVPATLTTNQLDNHIFVTFLCILHCKNGNLSWT